MIGTLQNSSESHLYEVTELHSLVHGCLDEPREVPRYDCKRSRIARLSFLVSIRQVIRRMSMVRFLRSTRLAGWVTGFQPRLDTTLEAAFGTTPSVFQIDFPTWYARLAGC